MGQPAARFGDMHVCPMVTPGTPPIPHVGGPILPTCSINVLTGKIPQARVTDKCLCVGPPDVIIKGSMTVLVNKLSAARMFDSTAHGGVIMKGELTVLIGDGGAGGGGWQMIIEPGGVMRMIPASTWQAAVATLARAAPNVVGDLNAIALELVRKLGIEFMRGSSPEILARALTGVQAFEKASPFMTAATAKEIGQSVAGAKTGIANAAGNAMSGLSAVLSFTEAAAEAANTYKFAVQGKKLATAISAADTTGSIVVASAGYFFGALAAAAATLALGATAPVWGPIVIAGLVGTGVAIGTKYLWDKYGQDRVTESYLGYINSPSSPEILSSTPIAIAAGIVVGVGTTALLVASAPGWVPVAAGVAAASVAYICVKAAWNKWVQ